MDALKDNRTLGSFFLGSNEIKFDGDQASVEGNKASVQLPGAEKLATVLGESNPKLRTLYLSTNEAGDTGAKAFAATIKKIMSYKKLILVVPLRMELLLR